MRGARVRYELVREEHSVYDLFVGAERVVTGRLAFPSRTTDFAPFEEKNEAIDAALDRFLKIIHFFDLNTCKQRYELLKDAYIMF